jgi:predicted xylose isomerase-like sugar epimerase
MNMKDVRALAKDKGVKIGSLNKVQAVRAIQLVEGNFDCFARAVDGYCDQQGCLFHDDCLKLSSTDGS